MKQTNMQNELDLFNQFEEFLASKQVEVSVETIEAELALNEQESLVMMRRGAFEDILRLSVQRYELKSCLIDLLKKDLEKFKKAV